MHLEELLCRYESGDVTDAEREQVKSHLEECKDCHRMWGIFRTIDTHLKMPIPPSTEKQKMLKTVHKGIWRMRWIFIACSLSLVPAILVGVLFLTAWQDDFEFAAHLGAALIASCIWSFVELYRAWIKTRRLNNATQNWNRLKEEWRNTLDHGIKKHKSTAILWGILGCVGLLSLIAFYVFEKQITLIVGITFVPISAIILSAYSRNLQGLKRQRQALEELE